MQNMLVHEDVTLDDVGFIGPVAAGLIQAGVAAGSAAYGAYTNRKIAAMQGKHANRMAARQAALESKQIAIDQMLATATVQAGDAKREHQEKINVIQLKIQRAQASLMERKLQQSEALQSIQAAEQLVVATGRAQSTAKKVAAGTYKSFQEGNGDKILGMDKKTFTMVAVGVGALVLGAVYFAAKR